MRTDPITDSLNFLAGNTDDHQKLGMLGAVLAGVFAVVLLASVAIAVVTWQRDRQQRRGAYVWLWFVRVTMGAMWFQGSLWKLPLPVAGGLRYWTEQLRDNSAYAWHRSFVSGFLLHNLHWLGTLVWLTEFGMAVALMLGLAVRLIGLVGVLFTLNLWIGLYHNGGEWPWTYVFIMLIEGGFVVYRAGYALGLDALIAGSPGNGLAKRLHRFVS